MQRFCMILFVFMCSFLSVAHADDQSQASGDSANVAFSSLGVQEVSLSSLSSVERNVRDAAVKVIAHGGHGSGTYVKYRRFHIVLTAAHVTMGTIGDTYEIQAGSNSVVGVLVYEDRDIDAAAILVPSIPDRNPMRYRPLSQKADIGTTTLYSGYPSDMSLMSIRGSVAGYEWTTPNGPVVMLHTYGWFGCSGSGIYDSRGRYVGVLWGVSIERAFVPQVIEDIIWVTPAHMIDESAILSGIVNLSETDNAPSVRVRRSILRRLQR